MYQLDSNPLIARLSTSADIGAVSDNTTNSMVPCLAIYETEPVDSALQLFYESSTVGLIADLNADVDTGFDGVAGLETLSYNQDENDATNTAITAVFRPENNLGAAFNNTAIETGYPKLLSVVDGTGAARVSGAGIVDAPAAGDQFKIVTSGNGYKIHTNTDTFVFGSDGATKEVYTFTIQWKVQATGDISSTTSIGSLTNIVPEFTAGASFPTVTVSISDTVVVTRGGNNGSATNSTSGLKYSIVSGNSGNYFSINSNTGAITKTNTTPAGSYTLGIKLEDAVNGSGTPQTGSLSVTQNQVVNVGATAVNSGVISSCLASGVVSAGIPATQQSIIPDTVTGSAPISAAWYISDSTYTRTNFNSLPGISNIPANNSNSNYVYKLGSALTQGTVVFQCNMQQKYTGAGGTNFTNSYVEWLVFHRSSGSGNWTNANSSRINDINNSNIEADANLLNNSLNSTKYASTAFAFDQPGEYVIIAKDAYNQTAGAYSDSLCLWVNSNDLYYSTCVVENGANEVSTSNPKYYKYDVSGFQTGYNCATGNTAAYAPMPYAQYVDLFYTDTALVSPWTSATVGSNFPNFLSFRVSTTSPKKPFDQVRVSAKFGTDGIKISGDNTTCSDTYARGCVSSNTSCARPVPGDYVWP